MKKSEGETMDLAGQRPDKLQELQSAWDRINDETIEPIWSPTR